MNKNWIQLQDYRLKLEIRFKECQMRKQKHKIKIFDYKYLLKNKTLNMIKNSELIKLRFTFLNKII